jgi:monoamine oxidase
MEKFDFIVVGAGYAGLTAANGLLKPGKSVKVLEARERVGGRVHTQQIDDYYVDLGGTWVGPSQDRIYALLKELNIATFKTYDEGKSSLLMNDRLKKYNGVIPPMPIPALLSLDRAIKTITKLSKTIDLNAPWLSVDAEKWDGITLQGWMDKQMRSTDAKRLFKIASEAIWAVHPNEISMLHALFYTKSGRDFDTLMNVKNGAQEERIVGGAQSAAIKLASQFPTNTIKYNAPVKSILQDEEEVLVSGEDFLYRARRVIVAVPPTIAGKINYNNQLPANRTQLMQRMPMGSVWKCYAVYDKPFWRENNQNGLGAIDGEYITVTFDNSPKDSSKGILMGFVLGNQAKNFSLLNDQERKQNVLNTFINLYGEKAKTPINYIEKSWAMEEYSGGCYAGIMPTGVWTSLGKSLREPCGRIHWAGTETSDIWNGYIDGAVRSGERVAKEVVSF